MVDTLDHVTVGLILVLMAVLSLCKLVLSCK